MYLAYFFVKPLFGTQKTIVKLPQERVSPD